MIGDKIRSLRKARKLTQEQLAAYLNISPQAVSKWETGMSSPDLDMLPRLAVFFRTTTDALLDFDRQRIDAEVETIVSDICPLNSDAESCYREALKKYPNNERLLNGLLTVIPSSRAKERIKIGEQLLDSATDDAIRLDVLRLLAQTCHYIGEQAMAENYLRQLPELSFLKNEIASVILKGEEQLKAIGKTEDMCVCTLCTMMELRRQRAESDEERERLRQLRDELLDLLSRDPVYRELADGVAESVKDGTLMKYYE